ncbi:MAG: RsmB/NOP family class I SAM-dependent RNA methyltransferase [Cyanobacteria bacterium J06627_8]
MNDAFSVNLVVKQPSRLLLKLSRRLFSDEAEQTAFVDALMQPRPLAPCILWCRDRPALLPFSIEPHRPEQPPWVDRLALDAQPGKHPLHDAGAYYCLDYSSIISASVLTAVPQAVRTVIDVCAAPGGKSVFAWRSLHPKLLLSNEVIGKRMAALISNLKRCQIHGAIALSLDSSLLAEQIPSTADVVIVDAPCTGQSLLAKGGKAEGCFHPVNINRNANRQKRIVANAIRLVAPQGYLAYMTCAYSPEENEAVMEWMLKQFPQLEPVDVPVLKTFQSSLSDRPCYRVWPQSKIGAGGFAVLLHNTEIGDTQPLTNDFLTQPMMRPIRLAHP